MSDRHDTYKPGDRYVMCARSGYKVRLSETVVETRTRLRVHRDWADPEHPHDHVRARKDTMNFHGQASESPDRFVTTNEITVASLTG